MCHRSVFADSPPETERRPRWSLLYGVVAPQLTALALVELAASPNVTRAVLRSVLALGTFAGMAVWLRANQAAFDLQQWCACAGATMTVRIVESRRPASPLPTERIEVSPAEEELEVVGP